MDRLAFGIIVFAVIAYSSMLLLPYNYVVQHSKSLSSEANPTAINGILTASAIVFGISNLSAERNSMIRKLSMEKAFVFFLLLLLQVCFLFLSGYSFFIDNVTYNFATLQTMLIVMISLSFNLVTWMISNLLGILWITGD